MTPAVLAVAIILAIFGLPYFAGFAREWNSTLRPGAAVVFLAGYSAIGGAALYSPRSPVLLR